MYAKRAFVHWGVGTGIEDSSFKEGINGLDYLI